MSAWLRTCDAKGNADLPSEPPLSNTDGTGCMMRTCCRTKWITSLM